MREYSFTNYIEIDGKDVPMDSLSEKERKTIAYAMQRRMIAAAGLQVRKKDKTA